MNEWYGFCRRRTLITTVGFGCFLIWILFGHIKYADPGLEAHVVGLPTNTEGGFDNYDYIQEMKRLNEEKVAADNPRLVQLIRQYFISPPSTQPYNLESPDKDDNSMGQAPIVDSRLQYKERGFFLESGAYDGETLSNTLFFERKRDWAGILIEPNPVQYKKLLDKHRRAYVINACLSTENYPSEKLIFDDYLTSKIVDEDYKRTNTTHKVQCFPLYSILLALNQVTIDYLSLDVEGAERGVLDTVPWHKVNIQMMTIEYNKWPGGVKSLCKYMEIKGYECILTISAMFVEDVILKKRRRQRH